MQQRPILWQIFSSYLLIMLAALVAVLLIGAILLRQSALVAVDGQLERIGREFELQLAAVPGDQFTDSGLAALQTESNNVARLTATRITVIDVAGRVLCDTRESPSKMENHGHRPEIIEALNGGVGKATRYSETLDKTMQYVAVPMMQQRQIRGVVRVAVPMSVSDANISVMQMRLLLAIVAAASVVIVICFVAARWLSRPLEEVSEGARRLAGGDPTVLLPAPNNREMNRVVEALRTMSRQLEEHSHAMGRKGTEQQAVLSSMVEGVLAVDWRERVIILNGAAAQIIGGKQADLVGRNLQEVIRNAELRRFASRALVSDEPIEDDVVLHGEVDRVLLVRGTALRDAQARSIGAVIVLNDVTHYRHLENIRRDFVANVSHELKTPIASIKGFVETLLDGALDEPADARRFLGIVAKQADRLNAIIEDLLSLSKIEQSEEAADLPLETGLVRDVLAGAANECQALIEQRGVQLSVECDHNLTARINSPLLQQAVFNLIDNALKYSEPNKSVRLVCLVVQDEIQIHVIDQGSGIAKEHLPRLFERFYRVDKARSRKVGGTGLGLAIVKHIVQAHHGRVSVTSAIGVGSTFIIHLPIIKHESSRP